ncbi:DEAD-box ATP-dependent RNA helicase 31-like [Olea europaea subsp. europaea]|uniref:ATP-dependent RNA helicase n=1 Tax=Olea europaea subsp. europaea TaxID=158383 RepID=A0A8S0SK58_OLEEU|nr:DEAD-box ATP-dependent RNA helicase 31-like [Olea europaea subsp. europaea]
MKSDPLGRRSRTIPVISRIFPHKFKYQSLGSLKFRKRLLQEQFHIRKLWGLGMLGVCGSSSNSFKKNQLLGNSDNDEVIGYENGKCSSRKRCGKRGRTGELDNTSKQFLGSDLSDQEEKTGGEEMKREGNGVDEVTGSGNGKCSSRKKRAKRGGKGELDNMSKQGGGCYTSDREEKNGRDTCGNGEEMKRYGNGVMQRDTIVTVDAYTSFKELMDGDGVDDADDDDEGTEEVVVEDHNGILKKGSVTQLPPSLPGRSDSYLSESRFDQFSISLKSLKGLKDAGYEKMTVVQEATLPVILKGKDVLAKAKTGSGKTVAFLLPAIEAIVKSPPIAHDQKHSPILVLVLCPTRELASQVAAEAGKLLKYHPSIGAQVVIGGIKIAQEQKQMRKNSFQILVATPGRLIDHLQNSAGFATRLKGVQVLVLDEADRLLDMGFRKDIEKIISAVTIQRQTLLFSATIPDEVHKICDVALKLDHEFINTVQEGLEETNSQVRQMHIAAPLGNHFSILYTLLKEHIKDDANYKVLVFCTTAMVTRFIADLLMKLNLYVREIHSRKPQSYRNKISDEFRKSKGLVLVTSDVSARGVDYPDITLVLQIGVPADRQQYIHRLGRTGRKGKEGRGILLLAPWEEFFLSSIKDLPITKASEPMVDSDSRKQVSVQ